MEPMVLLNICWHYLNVPMNSVHVAKFIAKKEKNANVRCVTLTSDVRNNRNTVVFEKWTWFCHKIGDFSTIVLK